MNLVVKRAIQKSLREADLVMTYQLITSEEYIGELKKISAMAMAWIYINRK